MGLCCSIVFPWSSVVGFVFFFFCYVVELLTVVSLYYLFIINYVPRRRLRGFQEL